jgi:hypothetical protein
MRKQKEPFEWFKNIPGWAKGAIALVTATIGFVLLFQEHPNLVVTVVGVFFLTGVLCGCIYLVFAKTPPLIEGGKGVYRFERFRPWALLGILFVIAIIVAVLAWRPTRSFVVAPFVKTPTSRPTSTLFPSHTPAPTLTPTPVRQDDAIHQDGEIVARVSGVVAVEQSQGRILFEEIYDSNSLDLKSEFEFQKWRLVFREYESFTGLKIGVIAGVKENVFGNVECEIIGERE